MIDNTKARVTIARYTTIPKLIQDPPRRLLEVAQQLVNTLGLESPALGPAYDDVDDTDTSALKRSVDLGDRCPACRDPILLGHLTRAVCTRGHRWGESN